MGIIATVKRWFNMLFKSTAEQEFKIETVDMPEMEALIQKCANIYRGIPYWADPDEGIKSINFAKAICSETARLATLGVNITLDGSARAEYLSQKLDIVYDNLRRWAECACAFGTVFLKPNGDDVDIFTPFDVLITESDGSGNITGIIFREKYTKGRDYYTRLEYNRFEDGIYKITTKAYKGTSEDDLGTQVDLAETRWAGIMDEMEIADIDRPLYAVIKTPQTNNIDINSCLGMPMFSDSIEELKDLDTAYSRQVNETFDSQKIILADDRLMQPDGMKLSESTPEGMEGKRKKMGLPRFLRNVFGSDSREFYQEIVPSMNTDARISGINALLSQIGYKNGYSNGYFVFNQKSGYATATQVEAEQSRTLQTIEDIRRQITAGIYDLIYAMNVFADYDNTTPHEDFDETVYTDESESKIHIHYGNIYENKAEERARAYNLAQNNYYSKAYYLHMYEDMSKEEAEKLVSEAQPETPTLFGDEE